MTASPVSMQGLALVPFDPAWLLENRAFLAGDPKLVRAVPKLLIHAWRATPAGSIPADFQRIGSLCDLSDTQVGEHFDDLLEGWELRDGRFFHIAMSALCEKVAAKFGEVLSDLQAQAAAMPQAPEEFELTAPTVEARTKGRRLLPKDFMLTDERRLWLKAHGFETSEDQDWILEKFVTWARKDSEKMSNWEAGFHNFCLKENKRFLPSRQTAVVPLAPPNGALSRSQRYGGSAYGSANRGEQAVDHNMQMLRGGRGG
ncbi:hypothetical protein [Ramlibacter sp. AN1133]|uniref:hypothetical protein n=1 Tax=Ramlibacter sp. AN1133 TaxID=3133429 RepID=UPI0030C60EBB